MKKKKRIIIVGLPHFAKRLANDLQEYKPDWKVISLNTYYSKLDKLKALFLVPKADVVYSINGSLLQSKVFDLALKFRVKLIMNWAGTDVLKAIDSVKNSAAINAYIDKAIHVCQAPWIKEELQSIGIESKEIQYISFKEKNFKPKPFPSSFSVLCYIPENRMYFYGYEFVKSVIENCPNINFRIVGTKSGFESYNNAEMLGWIDNFDQEVENSICYLRCPEHDGLSTSVLEVLSKGRYVFYNYNYPHSIRIENVEQVCNDLKQMKYKFEEGSLELNNSGSLFISKNFNYSKVMGELVTLMSQE